MNVMTYRAPLDDILLALNHGAGFSRAIEAGHSEIANDQIGSVYPNAVERRLAIAGREDPEVGLAAKDLGVEPQDLRLIVHQQDRTGHSHGFGSAGALAGGAVWAGADASLSRITMIEICGFDAGKAPIMPMLPTR